MQQIHYSSEGALQQKQSLIRRISLSSPNSQYVIYWNTSSKSMNSHRRYFKGQQSPCLLHHQKIQFEIFRIVSVKSDQRDWSQGEKGGNAASFLGQAMYVLMCYGHCVYKQESCPLPKAAQWRLAGPKDTVIAQTIQSDLLTFLNYEF